MEYTKNSLYEIVSQFFRRLALFSDQNQSFDQESSLYSNQKGNFDTQPSLKISKVNIGYQNKISIPIEKIKQKIYKKLHKIFVPINPTQKKILVQITIKGKIPRTNISLINNKTKIIFYYSITSLIKIGSSYHQPSIEPNHHFFFLLLLIMVNNNNY